MRRAVPLLAVVLIVLVQIPANVRADVYRGFLIDVPESGGTIIWGDGVHDIYSAWSVKDSWQSGWLYGTMAAIYDAGPVSVATVADASVFPYTWSTIPFTEGDTVFFRSGEGYYGAWRVLDIHPSNNPPQQPPYAYMTFEWFFLSDRSADFTVIPEPSNLSFLFAGLLAWAGAARWQAGARRELLPSAVTSGR